MSRPDPGAVRRVACVGVGTIGAGWAAYFLARGLDVVATDPAPGAAQRVRALVDDAWPKLERLGLSDGADRARLTFVADLAEAVADVEFIQESALDYEELKVDLFAQIDAAAPADTVISSSSSKFRPTVIASRCTHPERCIVGHPFVPSYLVPLVEVVGGEQTSRAVLDWSVAFYDHIGKHALLLRKECDAYISNRLQHVVFQEASRMVEEGVC